MMTAFVFSLVFNMSKERKKKRRKIWQKDILQLIFFSVSNKEFGSISFTSFYCTEKSFSKILRKDCRTCVVKKDSLHLVQILNDETELPIQLYVLIHTVEATSRDAHRNNCHDNICRKYREKLGHGYREVNCGQHENLRSLTLQRLL